jgi:metallo-beta-lactamase class B
MKRLVLILIFTGLIHYGGFSQNGYKRIRISKDIELIKLSENAYIHVSYADYPQFGRLPANGLVFINGGEAFLMDTPVNDTLTKDLVVWLTDSMNLKIVGFVPNHWHNDCMGGLGYLQSRGIDSYASQMTVDIAKTKNLPVPAHGFKDSIQLQLGDKSICCYFFGAAHSRDNIVVWIPSERILFAGCMVKSLSATDLGNTVDGDLAAYPKTIGKLRDRFSMAKIVIPGHGEFGGLELIAHTLKLSTR